jgi:hypothetical protein
LEELYPDRFINLSVDAIAVNAANAANVAKADTSSPNNKTQYIFPYKIRRGYSYLCIAIELLDIKEFPPVIIENAIKMKNKICNDFNK